MKNWMIAAMAAVALAGSDARAQELSAKAREQIEAARRAAAPLSTPEAARAAGYVPVFGNVPLQGEHYVRMDLVQSDRFDISRPPVLMFAPVDGRDALVGAAYAYLHPTRAAAPDGFDGDADQWHAHDDLTSVPGKHIVMTHVWFAETPDGPFARYNPWLPFLAAGLTPPPRDAASARGVRELALAVALATGSAQVVERVEHFAGPELAAKVRPHRDTLRALLPRLRAAQSAGDTARYERLAAEAVEHSTAMIEAFRSAAGSPDARRAIDRVLNEFFEGEHSHHGE